MFGAIRVSDCLCFSLVFLIIYSPLNHNGLDLVYGQNNRFLGEETTGLRLREGASGTSIIFDVCISNDGE